MNSHSDKQPEHNTKAIAHDAAQTGNAQPQFRNERPEAGTGKALQAMMMNSPQALQLRAFSRFAPPQPVAQRAITHGQSAAARALNKGNLGSLTPQRLITKIKRFISMNKVAFYDVATDAKLRTAINDVIEDIGVAKPVGYDDELALVKAEGYNDINGAYGSVPAAIVEQLATQWRIAEATIQTSVGKIAAPRGDNGVKILNANPQGYTAELKIMRMGDDRVFSTTAAAPYVFDTVGPGLHD